jgi:hypothetical protein
MTDKPDDLAPLMRAIEQAWRESLAGQSIVLNIQAAVRRKAEQYGMWQRARGGQLVWQVMRLAVEPSLPNENVLWKAIEQDAPEAPVRLRNVYFAD